MSERATELVQHPEGRHVEVRRHRLWVETAGSKAPLLVLSGLGPAGSHVVFHPSFWNTPSCSTR